MPLFFDLLYNVHSNINRNGKGQPHRPTRPAINLRVHTNDFAIHIKQWASRVAWIDGHIGLNKGHVIFRWKASAFRTHNTGGNRSLKSKRRPDCQHPFTHLEFFRVADFHSVEIFAFNFDDCDVCTLVGAYHFSRQLAAIV